MRIQTFTIVAGSEACNAVCPYCVSRMTPDYDLDEKLPAVNWRNFGLGCRFAKDSGVTTVLLTGKGEPTLFPDQLTAFMEALEPFAFPFLELQTNGLAIADGRPVTEEHLRRWYDLGLSTVALSVVHWESEQNAPIYRPRGSYPDLAALVERLHERGFSVRITAMLVKGIIDTVEEVERLADWCRVHEVEQCTVRRISRPAVVADPAVGAWVDAHRPPDALVDDLRERFDRTGTRLLELVHGAVVYDVKGQNLCLSNCLTRSADAEQIRQLIFFPDGHLRYDWQHPGAILL